jgi:uncharacterized protein YbbC (DUF1343 family)
MRQIQTGIERLLTNPPSVLREKRLGLLANPASVGYPDSSRKFRSTRLLISDHYPGQLKVLFCPQHGFFAEKQANMIASEGLIDPVLQIPVYSLYGENRTPSRSMFEPIDVIIIDLQDVGTRVYTYIYTMALCMQAARTYKKEVLVLDRPNPAGGSLIEGNCVRPGYTSFVGMYPIPMRHGLTIGELALLFNDHFGIGSRLSVISMAGWRRNMLFEDTGLPWIPPSPNLPTPASALVYPGQVLWEGTNLSEGRGTTQPFEIFGAPFLDAVRLEALLSEQRTEGAHLRPLAFEPTSDKWAGRLCHGFQIHVIDTEAFRPYKTTLALLQAVISLHPESFRWQSPPYEYELEKLPFDVITGDPLVRKAIENQDSLEDLEERWAEELKEFEEIRRPFLLYDPE